MIINETACHSFESVRFVCVCVCVSQYARKFVSEYVRPAMRAYKNKTKNGRACEISIFGATLARLSLWSWRVYVAYSAYWFRGSSAILAK